MSAASPLFRSRWKRRWVVLAALALTLAALRAAPLFVTPLEGEAYRDWTIVNYVDLDPTGGIQDYQGGSYSYDGHAGVDFTLKNFAAMDAGFDVYAGADGVVVEIHDGEFDRNTANESVDVNFVTLDHGGGWRSVYYHLKRNSIRVAEGDTVVAGQKIAEVGSSGRSTDAHLHFEVQLNGQIVDPFLDDLWAAPLPYAGDHPGVLDAGICEHFLDFPEFKEGAPKQDTVGRDTLGVHWVQLYDVGPSDVLRWKFYAPNKKVSFDYSLQPTELIRYGWYQAGANIAASQTGAWTSRFYINGKLASELQFESTSAEKRAIAVSGDLSFGEVEVGKTAQRTVTIANTGNNELFVSGITHTQTEFAGTFTGPIPPGESRVATITFTPVSAEGSAGTLSVISNANFGQSTLAESGNTDGTSEDRFAAADVPATITSKAVKSTVTVSGQPASLPVSDIKLDLDLTYAQPEVLSISLKPPKGKAVKFSLPNQGVQPVVLSSQLFPSSNVVNPNGTWTLSIKGKGKGATGTLNSWSLSFP